ncbi:transcription intermediary factor 1-alpha-like [Mercenaria mercenaria]|uniref:transcription intermediary factor 1-alpha-like n=1 Tax=Mercenaria mercenaria TaxID=6596 RepID=UPI00234FA8A3|nr:transcription intermediary factor 1-alpha-like [Mercenaria mercenaria]
MASNVVNFSALQTQDSDEMKEMHCEECDKHLSKYVPANGFCVDCCVYMCDMCIMYHRRYMKQHNLKDKNNMPQDYCFEKCSVHSNELIKFYCEKCDKTACCECRKHNHPNCQTIKHLPTLVQEADQNKELTCFLNDMDTISVNLEETKKQLQSNLEYITSQETKEKLKITKHKEELVTSYSKQQKDIIENFDKRMDETIAKLKRERQELVEELSKRKKNFENKLNNAEKDVIKKIEKSKNSDQTKLDSLMKKTSTLIDELETLSNELLQKQNLGQKCHLFIAMKKAEGNKRNLGRSVSEITTKNKINFYSTYPTQTDLTIKALDRTTNFFSYKTYETQFMMDLDLPYVFFNIK